VLAFGAERKGAQRWLELPGGFQLQPSEFAKLLQILAAACENGIMQRAADEAKRSMEQFLRLLEFEQITVIATPGPCVVAQR
jgi:cell division protein FtsW (lipid II flippase)